MLKVKKVRKDKSRTYSQTKEALLQGELNLLDGGAALFSYGYELDLEGQKDAAEVIYRQTIELLERLTDKRDAQVRISELADLSFLHGQNLFELGRYAAASASFRRCLEIIDSIILLDASFPLIEQLGMTLNWLARSQRKAGNLQEARKSYTRAIGVWRSLLRLSKSSPRIHNLRHSLATALFGQSKALLALGLTKEAQSHKAESAELLRPYLQNSPK